MIYERETMILKEKKLSPALNLRAVQTCKFKTEMLSVCMILPIDADRAPVSLLALSVLKRGTEKYPTQGDLNRKLDALYATSLSLKSKRIGGCHVLGFSADMLDKKYTDPSIDVFGQTLDVISQMLFCPLRDAQGRFTDRYVESEKNTQCDTIEAQINNPRSYAMKRCREVMFEGDAYGVSLLGTVEQIKAIGADELADAYNALVNSSRHEVFYVGSRRIDEVEAILREQLLPYLSHDETASSAPGGAWDRKGEVRRVDEEMSLSQSRLVLGFQTGTLLGDEDFYPVLMLNEIYGPSPISKLFMNVREKMSLCYQCNSYYDAQKGVIFALAGINAADREKAEAEILRQLEDIKSGKITKAEFKAAKRSLFNNYRSVADSPSAIESFYTSRAERGLCLSPEKFMKKIAKVTLKDVIRVAERVKLDTVYFLKGNGKEGTDEDND